METKSKILLFVYTLIDFCVAYSKEGIGPYQSGSDYLGLVPLSIFSQHQIHYIDMPSYGYAQPTAIEVGANSIPITIFFRSKSSNLYLQQYHFGQSGSHQETFSEDEPHFLRHTVTKPILQEIKEIITPYRRIIQEIQPVYENIHTLVAKDIGNGGGIDGGRFTQANQKNSRVSNGEAQLGHLYA